MRKTFLIGLLIGVGMLILAGCAAKPDNIPLPLPTSQPAIIGMANPAAVFCQKNGGQNETRKDAAGNQYGVCVFADKTECIDWEYFRGECQPGDHQKAEPPSTTPNAPIKYLSSSFPLGLTRLAGWQATERADGVQFDHAGNHLILLFASPEAALPPLPAPAASASWSASDTLKIPTLGVDLPRQRLMNAEKVKAVLFGTQ